MICSRCGYANAEDALFCGKCTSPLVDEAALEEATLELTSLDQALLEKVLPDHLQLVRRLGTGGMATVYEAEDLELGQRVAVKVLPLDKSGDAELVKRFMREARLVASLKHEHIVPFHFMETRGQFHFFTMALMEGGSLEQRQQGVMTPDEAMLVVRQLASALAYAHGKGVIHRDIKPDNVMFDEEGKAYLADFGIAKGTTSTQLTATQVVLGTPDYLSPEQAQGREVGPASDLYALGALFFRLLTGRVVFPADDFLAVIARHLADEPVVPSLLQPEVPPAMDAIVLRLLAKKPEDRYPSAEDLIADLDAAAQGLPLAVVQTPVRAPARSEPETGPRRPKRALIAALLVVPLLALLIVFNPFEKSSPPTPEGAGSPVETSPAGGEQNRQERIRNALAQYALVDIPAGQFWRGNELRMLRDEMPVRRISIAAFRMGQTEVTQALWEAVMEDNPSCNLDGALPVGNVTWVQVQEFLRRLQTATGEAYRLPTEAEWEYACKAGRRGRGGLNLGVKLGDFAWFARNSDAVKPVGLKKPNDWGLYDMLGNAWEWCADVYREYFAGPEAAEYSTMDAESRVRRGGSWYKHAHYLRSANRTYGHPMAKFQTTGFRLVLEAGE